MAWASGDPLTSPTNGLRFQMSLLAETDSLGPPTLMTSCPYQRSLITMQTWVAWEKQYMAQALVLIHSST